MQTNCVGLCARVMVSIRNCQVPNASVSTFAVCSDALVFLLFADWTLGLTLLLLGMLLERNLEIYPDSLRFRLGVCSSLSQQEWCLWQ